MRYRKLDPTTKDYMLGQNQQDFLSGVDAVAQAIYTRLYLLQGEWWEDLEDGLPLMQRILGYRNTQNAADILIRKRIIETPNVLAMIDFVSEFNNDTRVYTFSCTVETAFGQVALTEVSI
jgi:hypothetical protein